jgi:Protein of unknown function (DUF1566)/PKD domain
VRRRFIATATRLAPAVLVSACLAACGGSDGGAGMAANTRPVASAGRDVTALRNVLVLLDGSASSDADGDALTYAWTVVSRPPGSTAALSDPSTAAPTLTVDVSGTYTIGLVVSDGRASSTPDSVDVVALASVSNLHDTGLGRCFANSAEIACPASGAAFAGQDAQVSTNPMRFTDGGATVTDGLTGLTWQKLDPVARYNWYQAMGVQHPTYNPSGTDVCGSSSLGGYGDWRLPSRRELVSIVNYAQGGPDQGAFQGSGVYWSSTRLGSPSGTVAWVVYGGQVGYGIVSGLGDPCDVKCVRGAPWGQNAFTDHGDGTVTDTMSGLRWQQSDDGIARNWEEALASCEGLTLAGSADWRLPDIKELESLVYLHAADFSTPMDVAFFTPSQDTNLQSFYWSSTTSQPWLGGGAAWGVDFYAGTVDDGGFSKAYFKFSRCVR